MSISISVTSNVRQDKESINLPIDRFNDLPIVQLTNLIKMGNKLKL